MNFSSDRPTSKSPGTAIWTVSLALVQISWFIPASMAQQTPSHAGVLKGKVERLDQPTRIKRPVMPQLSASVNDDVAVTAPIRGKVVSESDFVLNFKLMTPTTDEVQQPKNEKQLRGEAENKEMIIAWERWHHAIARAIFERWTQNSGNVLGEGQLSIHVTREGQVSCETEYARVEGAIYEVFPLGADISIPTLTAMFQQQMTDSVLPLSGAAFLPFPDKSRRSDVVFKAPFSCRHQEKSYGWKTNDFERVPLK